MSAWTGCLSHYGWGRIYAMVKKLETICEESTAQQECCHHWIIESAAGPVSQGVCKFCGAQKEFKNYLLDCLKMDVAEMIDRSDHDTLHADVWQLAGKIPPRLVPLRYSKKAVQ